MQDRSNMLYEDIYSPTACLSHLFIVACIAAREGRHVRTIRHHGGVSQRRHEAGHLYAP